jgi:hypothetical protein
VERPLAHESAPSVSFPKDCSVRLNWKVLAAGVLLAGLATATYVPFVFRDGTRGVGRVFGRTQPASGEFRRDESAALFVGVRKFSHEEVAEVQYAVDDAVDLAYTFAMCRRIRLVPPHRVVLALSGRPKKPESQRRLRELEEAGAQVEQADPSDIRALLQKQAALAGPNGMLIVSLATHGYAREGIGYILGATSLPRDPETTLSTAKILDIIGSSRAQRSIVFIDACRERMMSGTRAVRADVALSALFRRMKHVHGQAVLFAAAEGQVAYDGDGNGVFTKAVVEGLQQCEAAAPRGTVTAETLSEYVDRKVREWIRANRDPSAPAGIQWNIDGEAKNMPLAPCGGPPLPGSISSASTDGSTITTFTVDGKLIWERAVAGIVQRTQVSDLDADRSPEVIAGMPHSLLVFDDTGNEVWSAAEDDRPLRSFAVADGYRKKTKDVVALWEPARVAIYGADGRRVATHDFDHRLDYMTVDRPTSRHMAKIVLAGDRTIAVFNPSKINRGEPLWTKHLAHRITRLTTTDGHDGQREIAVEISGGRKVVLDFEGKVVRGSS